MTVNILLFKRKKPMIVYVDYKYMYSLYPQFFS